MVSSLLEFEGLAGGDKNRNGGQNMAVKYMADTFSCTNLRLPSRRGSGVF